MGSKAPLAERQRA